MEKDCTTFLRIILYFRHAHGHGAEEEMARKRVGLYSPPSPQPTVAAHPAAPLCAGSLKPPDSYGAPHKNAGAAPPPPSVTH